MSKWIIYLKQMKLRQGYLGTVAGMALRELKGSTPLSMKKQAAGMEKPDEWMERIEDLELAWGSWDTVDICGDDWRALPGGGHVRRNHIGSHGR